MALYLLPFTTVQRLFARTSKTAAHHPVASDAYVRRIVWAVRAVGRRTLKDKPCLPQALVVQWLLKRRGYPTTLRIGVAKNADGDLLAHAWVEYESQIIIGGRTSSAFYTPLWAMEDKR